MAVDLFLVLLLQTEDNLRRYDPFVRIFEVKIRVQSKRSCVLEKMAGNGYLGAVGKFNRLLHHPILIDTKKGQAV
jgi:hypothetical protein